MKSAFPLLFVLLSCACAGPPVQPGPEAPASPPPRPPVIVMPVPAKAVEGSAAFEADWSFDIRAAEHFSVHVHVVPPGQMVPLHVHPKNWEMTFVAAGVAEWTGVARVGGALVSETTTVGPGEAMVAPVGAAHQVRNRGTELLAAVVVHQPEFGQNWYLPAEEVTGSAQSHRASGDIDAPPGWQASWVTAADGVQDRERILLVASGAGTLAFEDQRVPLLAGHVASVPAGLSHQISGDAAFSALSLLVPSTPHVP